MKFEWLPVTRFAQNCSILWCEQTRKAAVIDPGGDLDQVETFLELEELELEVALITHGHFDHAGGAARLKATTGARIEGPHRGDEQLLRGLTQAGERYGIRADSFTPDRWLEDGDVIRFGEVTLDVLHCPGHSKGHVAYVHKPSGHAFVGDILFRGAIGAWEHRDGDLEQLIASIRGKLFPLGDAVSFLPGHGETSTFGRERAENPFVGDAAIARWWARRRPDLASTADPGAD